MPRLLWKDPTRSSIFCFSKIQFQMLNSNTKNWSWNWLNGRNWTWKSETTATNGEHLSEMKWSNKCWKRRGRRCKHICYAPKKQMTTNWLQIAAIYRFYLCGFNEFRLLATSDNLQHQRNKKKKKKPRKKEKQKQKLKKKKSNNNNNNRNLWTTRKNPIHLAFALEIRPCFKKILKKSPEKKENLEEFGLALVLLTHPSWTT